MGRSVIYYLACKHRSLGVQLRYFPGKLADQLRFLTYEDLFGRATLPWGTFIFTDFDRLPPDRFARLCKLWDWFEATACPLPRLNDPRRALSRFDLLRRLHDAGINDFNVYALENWREVRRFPVFRSQGQASERAGHETARGTRGSDHPPGR